MPAEIHDPRFYVAADFNGNGQLDIATGSTGGVGVYLDPVNSIPFPYYPPVYSCPAYVAGIEVGDFNGDGKLDLAAAIYETGQVSILLGNGDGSFQPHVDFPAGLSPFQVVTGDFNGDGALDLAVPNSATGISTVSILLGNGDGTFQAPTNYTLGADPAAVALGDFNRDGKLDLVAANRADNTVSILLGNGDGTFQDHVDHATGSSLSFVLAADFSGDEKLDLAVGTYGGVSILIGNGDGTFKTGVDYAIYPGSGGSYDEFVAGDSNADGKVDLAFDVGISGGVYVSVLPGNGDGTFQAYSLRIYNGRYFGSLAAGDFNGDGLLDFAVHGAEHLHVSLPLYPQLPTAGLAPLDPWFSNQGVGTTSPPVPITLRNNWGSPLAISDITVSGSNSSEFPETNNCPVAPSTLAAGSSCTINVTFAPTVRGSRSAVLAVTVNVPGGAQSTSQSTTLSGTGIEPVVSLSPTSLTFAGQNLGSTSAPQTVTLANSGIDPLTIATISVSGDFAQTNTCETSVAPGGSCTISVTFAPLFGVTFTGTLTIQDNALGSPHAVSLAGTGVPPTVTLSATSLTFGSLDVGIMSPALWVTVTNNGPGVLTILSVVASGDFAQNNNCVGMVDISANCTVNVTFTPSTPGARSGMLSINDNAIVSPQTATLTGTGNGPVVSVSPSFLTFGGQPLGTTSDAQTVILLNNGNSPLSIAGIATSWDFVQTNGCSASLAAGASCIIRVTFTPSVAGPLTGALTIADNGSDSPQSVILNGRGITAPAVGLSPTALSFPPQFVGTTGLPQNITLINTGSAALTITDVQATTDFAATSGCTSSVPPQISCTISVFFDPSAAGARTGTLTITDNAPGSPHTVALSGTGQDFNLAPAAGSSTTTSVTAGSTATFSLSLAPAGGFDQTVSLTCTGAPPLSTCTVSPAVATLSPTASTPVQVSVRTTAHSVTPPRLGPPPTGLPSGLVWWLAFSFLAILAVGAVGGRGRMPLRLGLAGAILFAVMLGAVALPSCGGSTTTTGGGGGTPSGTYHPNVTGTFTSGTTTLSRSIQLTLTVY